MKRRQMLSVGAAGLSTLLTGCTSNPDTQSNHSTEPQPASTTQAPSTQTQTPTSTSSSQHRDVFLGFLEDLGVTVFQLTSDPASREVELQYKTSKTDYEELGAEIGAISGGYFRQVTEGWQMDQLNAAIVQSGTDPDATWYAKTAWLREYQNDEISSQDLSIRVLETLEPIEDN